jgi:CheY-like chemotaxis protein
MFRHRFSCIEAGSAREAIRVFVEAVEAASWPRPIPDGYTVPVMPDIVLSDYEMPRENGEWLISELHEFSAGRFRSVPLILCSGNHEAEDVARRYGVPFYLKGSDPKRLISLAVEMVAAD